MTGTLTLHDRVVAVIVTALGQNHLFTTPEAIRAGLLSGARPVLPAACTIAGDLRCDLIDRMSIACALDEEFGIAIGDEAVESWATVGDIVASVEACRIAGELP